MHTVLIKKSLKLVYSYLSKLKQIVKKMTHAALAGGAIYLEFLKDQYWDYYSSISLCSASCSMFDMFYLLENHRIANYTGDFTPYSAKTNHKLVIEELEKSSLILFQWLLLLRVISYYLETLDWIQTLITTWLPQKRKKSF